MFKFYAEYMGQKTEVEAHNTWQAQSKAAIEMGIPKSREKHIHVLLNNSAGTPKHLNRRRKLYE